jgi:hypothetical protein
METFRLRRALVAIALLAALPAAGQEEPLPDLFSDVLDVRVVNVEVVVTDKKGYRIPDLEASDFELLVDGDRVPIDYFTEIDQGRAVATQEEGVGNVPSLTSGAPVGTNFLVFIDELFQRDGFLTRLEKDLARLDPSDQVAIVAFDGYRVTRLTDWTNSRQKIEDAIVRARERRALGLLRMPDLGDVADQVRRTAKYGDHSRNLGSRIPILYAETPPPGETFVYETVLPIRKREHRFLAAVYDPVTGQILSREGVFTPR